MAIVKKLKQYPPLPPSRYEVGIYCRVSTASKTQVVSAGHQLSAGLLPGGSGGHAGGGDSVPARLAGHQTGRGGGGCGHGAAAYR